MSQDLTLAELAATLRFDALQADLSTISLHDVLTTHDAEPADYTAANLEADSPEKVPEVHRRRRRSAQQTEEMKQMIMALVRESRDGLTTPAIADALRERGFDTDQTACAIVLKAMGQADELRDDAGRPKTWRIKNVGQRVPAPMVIRKAQVIEQEQQSTPVAPAASGGLFSHGEIQAAAAALRERFFAKD